MSASAQRRVARRARGGRRRADRARPRTTILATPSPWERHRHHVTALPPPSVRPDFTPTTLSKPTYGVNELTVPATGKRDARSGRRSARMSGDAISIRGELALVERGRDRVRVEPRDVGVVGARQPERLRRSGSSSVMKCSRACPRPCRPAAPRSCSPSARAGPPAGRSRTADSPSLTSTLDWSLQLHLLVVGDVARRDRDAGAGLALGERQPLQRDVGGHQSW